MEMTTFGRAAGSRADIQARGWSRHRPGSSHRDDLSTPCRTARWSVAAFAVR